MKPTSPTPLQFDSLTAAGQSAKAILELTGDELTMNTSLTGESHAASFEPGAGLVLVKYNREGTRFTGTSAPGTTA